MGLLWLPRFGFGSRQDAAVKHSPCLSPRYGLPTCRTQAAGYDARLRGIDNQHTLTAPQQDRVAAHCRAPALAKGSRHKAANGC